jgi:hypothetical protein
MSGLGIAALALEGGKAIGNWVSQAVQNKRNRQFAREQARWQRDTSRENWMMENEYNTPRQQMQRLQEAGLNPNLVYGNGADAMGGKISNPEAGQSQGTAPRLEGNAILAYADIKAKTAQTDLLQEQVQLAKQEQIWKAIQANKTLLESKMVDFDLSMKKNLAENTMEFARENLRQLSQNIYQSQENFNMDMAIKQQTWEQAVFKNKQLQPLEKEKMIEQIQSEKFQNTIREIQAEWAKKGVMPNDPYFHRVLTSMIERIINEPDTVAALAAGKIPAWIITMIRILGKK